MTQNSLLPDDWALPNLPDKRYFTTSEVAHVCNLKQHVLRYWEKEFTSIQPTRKKGGRRYFHYNDVVLICFIQLLVHHQNYSLDEARQCLKHYGKSIIVKEVLAHRSQDSFKQQTTSPAAAQQQTSAPAQTASSSSAHTMLEAIKQDLQDALEHLKQG